MLIEKYLPHYHFREMHSIKITSTSEDLFDRMKHCDLSQYFLVKFLFRIRGIRGELATINDITRLGFTKLDEMDQEVVYGILSNSPTFNGCKKITLPSEFIELNDANLIKAVINFNVKTTASAVNYKVSTETRVWCGSHKMKRKFAVYWFFVQPFSRMIRQLMLRQLRKQLEIN